MSNILPAQTDKLDRSINMISKEQLANLTEVLATASVVGIGWALGGKSAAVDSACCSL